MSAIFKIYFKDIGFEKKVLLKGDFSNYTWFQLRDTMIAKSKSKVFKHHKKELKERDDFIIEFLDLPKGFNLPLTSFWNNKTYNYICNNINSYKNEGKSIIRLGVSKVNKLPKWDLPKFDICLKKSLEKIWKKEEEIIKNKLNNIELEISKKIFALRKSNENDKCKNNNIICNSCLSIGFVGYRYICAHCNNFNLCENCYGLRNHNAEHTFILFKKVLNDDMLKYKNKFSPSTAVFKNIHEPFTLTLKIANIGENDLKNCFITYIKFIGKYLCCEKYVINENLVRNETIEIQLKINFKDTNIEEGIYEGQFRMFNENGIPFGDILNVRVKN